MVIIILIMMIQISLNVGQTETVNSKGPCLSPDWTLDIYTVTTVTIVTEGDGSWIWSDCRSHGWCCG